MISVATQQELLDFVGIDNFSKYIAVSAVHNTTKIKKHDLIQRGVFTDRVIKRISKYMCIPATEAELWLSRSVSVHNYDNLKSLNGLGDSSGIKLEDAWKGEEL